MFGLDATTLAFILFATLAVGGLIYAFMFDRVSAEMKAEKRVRSIQNRKEVARTKAAQRVNDVAKRKKTLQDSLKELESKQKEKSSKSIGLKRQIQQSGLKLTLQQFWLISIAVGLVLGMLTFVILGSTAESASTPLLGALAAIVIGGLGLPRWFVGFVRGRRMNRFVEEFPNAVDVIVRGVRAGLPVNDCLNIVAREAKEPVSTEFRRLIEYQQMGLTLSDSVVKLYDNVPLAESNFFGIVISIQQQAGGNLSEALGNLSAVLRDRKKMKAKIQAMSMEAKTSAGIIGALPFIVAILVYITTPDYIMLLFTHPTGNIVLVASGIWMSIGILVMKKMISFDF